MNKKTTDDSLWQTAVEGFAHSGKIPEIDLHGLNVAEASPLLEGFLNEQFMAGEGVVKVICGIGTGKLMLGIKEILSVYKKHGLVEDYTSTRSGGVYIVRIQV